MTNVRARGEAIRKYIISKVADHPNDIAKRAADRFGITRQATNKHLQQLVAEGCLVAGGTTRNRTYQLRRLAEWRCHYELTPHVQEDVVWRNDVAPQLGLLPSNVLDIWHYGFTEMFNNAIDHSDGSVASVQVRRNAVLTEIIIHDDGVGIFSKIQQALGLLDERHAILELAKGKLTTDPDNHTGEGIFFTSRMFNRFNILSGGVFFAHEMDEDEDWIIEIGKARSGTTVFMQLDNHTSRTTRKVFDAFTSGDGEFGFNKTVVPVALARYGDEQLVSRSQAKRLLARIDRFSTVVLDFKGVESIGQAFADQVFRVFANQHPEVELLTTNTSANVVMMIGRAKAIRPQ